MSTPELKLTYFGIAGAAEKVRLAFHIAGAKFTDERVNFEQWATLKPTTPNGQLPLLEVDGKVVTDSWAMLRYAGRLGGEPMYPTDPLAQLRTESLLGLAGDFDREWGPCLYLALRPKMFGFAEDYPKTEEGAARIKELRVNFATNALPGLLKKYVRELGGAKFFGGDAPSVVDCVIYAQLVTFTKGHLDNVPVTCLEVEPSIVEYLARFAAVPAVAAYHASLAK